MNIHFHHCLCFLSLLLTSVTGIAQQEESYFFRDNFEEQVLAYRPEQRAGVSEKNFKKAKYILEETASATERKPDNFNVADYFNILVAFELLNEPSEHRRIALERAIADSPGSLCEYFSALGDIGLSETVPDLYNSFIKECITKKPQKAFDVEAYVLAHPQLDADLVRVVARMKADDQRHRGMSIEETDWERQHPLDERNQEIVDSLYEVHRSYLGANYVGEELESVMWAVIQHSNTEMMELYLPVVHQATVEGEIQSNTLLKMLIDRYYSLSYKYQIFGSQDNFDFPDEATRQQVKEKYGFE